MASSEQPEPIVPVYAQPAGFKFFLSTWSGRIILVNTVVFILMALQSRSLFLPGESILLAWGAKDPVLLAQGEIWRLLTPIFVHIGIIHFAFNTWALYVIAYQIEMLMSGKWFLVLYLASGLIGNIASAVTTISVSAGASSSLFGLLGCGFYLERRIRRIVQQQTGARPRTGSYTVMVVANVGLGLMIPQIDNAAHIGGLMAGIVLTALILRRVPNRLVAPNRRVTLIGVAVVAVLCTMGVAFARSERVTEWRLVQILSLSTNTVEKYHLLTDLVRLRPEQRDYRMNRGLLLLGAGENQEAVKDLSIAAQDEVHRKKLIEMEAYYRNLPDQDRADALNKSLNTADSLKK